MALSFIKKIKDLIFKINKFKNLVIFLLVNKDFKLKQISIALKVFAKGINIGENFIPWIPIKAKIWLDKNLKSDMYLYEYGSGVSTLYFLTKVKRIISIEHDKDWYSKTKSELLKMGVTNYEYRLLEPESIVFTKLKQAKHIYMSNLSRFRKFNFIKYVRSIDQFPDNTFDFVFIDGRARIGCVLHSIKKIKIGGFLALDNSDEKKYKIIRKILKNYGRKDFFGIAPSNPYSKLTKISFWNTSIWKIE
ncbi:hypothetical protein LCGC14_1056930 [marine sediment metagenome]|uniref:Methyltransferase type 11 domain-containing protein n=1 Tax=marine sediment metagenome TaxID=412755 RepID=A0A0F9QT86_9ZZZZ|nr:MAG: hypothetical protein Lokiarch_16000 [Candidatus Lokiarchaeum sp. GC14_75]